VSLISQSIFSGIEFRFVNERSHVVLW